MMTLRLAWRNLWRNRNRTLITLAAVAFSTFVMIVSYALMEGIMVQILDNVTSLSMGEVQVHAPEYSEKQSFYASVKQPEKVLKAARGTGAHAVARSYGFGLAAADTKSAGARFWGVNPSDEKQAFKLYKHVYKGKYLGDKARGGVVLGKKLAFSLNVKVGDEIVALVQCADGSLGNELFTVTGILKTVGEEIDRAAAIIHIDDFDRLFVAGGRVHEIVINSSGEIPEKEMKQKMSAAFPKEKVQTWAELLPALGDMLRMFDGMMIVFSSIFALAAGLGVMNTLLMATYERMREFGVLKALGATPWRIVGDVAVEALLLALLGSVLGVLLSLPMCHYLAVVGIDMNALGGADISFSGVAYDPIWRATLTARIIIFSVLSMSTLAFLASLYPAVLAARLDPVKTMRSV